MLLHEWVCDWCGGRTKAEALGEPGRFHLPWYELDAPGALGLRGKKWHLCAPCAEAYRATTRALEERERADWLAAIAARRPKPAPTEAEVEDLKRKLDEERTEGGRLRGFLVGIETQVHGARSQVACDSPLAELAAKLLETTHEALR